jgi:hypothetical protein
LSEDLFTSQSDFLKISEQAAQHLYNQSTHAKIKAGELYVCYFSDVIVDGQMLDTIGFFKTENKETFLKIFQHLDEFNVECETGININKLDKGCLIFNSDKKNGFKIAVIDTNNRVAECANYWAEDFLNVELKPSAFYFTKNFIDTSRGFCEEILTEQNSVDKFDQQKLLNKSTSFFKDKTDFSLQNFETEVLQQPELIEAFTDYRKDFNKRMNLTAIDDFEISPTAVKQNNKYMRSVVKLDKNFHVYIHAKHDFVERGYDEEKNLKFYKLYYINEE